MEIRKSAKNKIWICEKIYTKSARVMKHLCIILRSLIIILVILIII